MFGILDSSTNHFGSLIRSGGKYIIPKFQRDYSWDKDQWDDLWQDILAMVKEDTDHYMGYLVLQSVSSKDCYVVDGQQRFTTITFIILAAIKAIRQLALSGVETEENNKRAETLTKTYIGDIDPVTLEYDNYLVLNRNNDSYYRDNIVRLGELRLRNTSRTEKLMRSCFEWYESRISGMYNTGREYAELISYIVDHLYFTIIRVSDEMNAFRVFETLNARGVQLSSADLLKNYLFSLVDNVKSPERIDVLEEKWSSLTKNIQAERLPDFIRYYWNSKNKTVRANELFKAIRDNISTDSEVFRLVADMLLYSDIYMALRNPDDELWQNLEKISDKIRLLNIFGLRQPFSLLMAAYHNLDIESFGRVLQDVLVFSFRYSVICDKNPNDIERVYNKMAIEISREKIYRKESLREIYVADDEFSNSFKNKSFVDNSKSNKIVKYILGRIERYSGGLRDVPFESETDTIEHILPRNPGIEWGEDNYEFDSLTYRLGNMCLLEKKFNKDVENKSFAAKKAVYGKSDFVTTHSIPDGYPEWNSAAINSRQRKMANIAKSLWRIDF